MRRALAQRAAALAAQGCVVTVFRQGDFNRALAEMDGAGLAALAEETAPTMACRRPNSSPSSMRCWAREEARLAGAPKLTLAGLLAAFPLPRGAARGAVASGGGARR
jgi:hypothetical protein